MLILWGTFTFTDSEQIRNTCWCRELQCPADLFWKPDSVEYSAMLEISQYMSLVNAKTSSTTLAAIIKLLPKADL